MAKNKYTSRALAVLGVFLAYLFAAARPVPPETVVVPRWLNSLESDYPVRFGEEEEEDPGTGPIPFRLGAHFGYIGPGGVSLVRNAGGAALETDGGFWALWEPGQERIEVRDPGNDLLASIPGGAGYPLFMDGRFFLVGDELNCLVSLDAAGDPEWTYDFAAPVTAIDAASGLVLAGFLDGTVELLSRQGKRTFFFEPGGSRLSAIYACRVSADGSRLAVISGYDDQRFLLLEKSGDSYKVVYHEFLSDGFRRETHLAFVDGDRRVVFEREGGLGIYDIQARKTFRVGLEGRIHSLEDYGGENLLFAVTSLSGTRKKLVGIRYPGSIILEAPFRSGDAFLARRGDRLHLGGGGSIASFSLERR